MLSSSITKTLLRTFSTAAKEAGKKQHPREIIQRKKTYPIYCVSEFGDLLNISPGSRSRQLQTFKQDLREVRIINDNTDANRLYKMLRNNESTYFLFDPEKGHYLNSRTLYQAVKKRITQRFYG